MIRRKMMIYSRGLAADAVPFMLGAHSTYLSMFGTLHTPGELYASSMAAEHMQDMQ